MADDWAMLPLAGFPRSGFWQTGQVGGPIDVGPRQLPGVPEHQEWEDVDGDGQIVIGAEQWPGCLNPATECANSSWYLWTTANKVMPFVFNTTSDQRSCSRTSWSGNRSSRSCSKGDEPHVRLWPWDRPTAGPTVRTGGPGKEVGCSDSWCGA